MAIDLLIPDAGLTSDILAERFVLSENQVIRRSFTDGLNIPQKEPKLTLNLTIWSSTGS